MGRGARQRVLVWDSDLNHDGGLHHAGLAYVWLTLAILALTASAEAQVSLGAGIQRDRFTYRFANDSAYDTSTLVPHFFEQTYNADNAWLIGSARYRAGVDWETAGGVTPRRTGTGDDYDTFFDPDGSVIVSGTTGGITIWSWRVEQRASIRAGKAISVISGYRLRVDHADWQLGHATTVRNGRLIDAHDTADREYTRSQMHEILMGVRMETAPDHRWRSQANVDVAPILAGRLLVQLPDKYPGRDLDFVAKGGDVTGTFSLSRRTHSLTFAICLQASRTWSYNADAELRRSTLGVGFTI